MKKMILAVCLLFGTNIYATDKAECEELFSSAIYAFYLENSCSLQKTLSVAITKVFEYKDCKKIFNDNDTKRVNNKVLGENYTKMNEVGRDEFCKTHKVSYEELKSVYMKNIN